MVTPFEKAIKTLRASVRHDEAAWRLAKFLRAARVPAVGPGRGRTGHRRGHLRRHAGRPGQALHETADRPEKHREAGRWSIILDPESDALRCFEPSEAFLAWPAAYARGRVTFDYAPPPTSVRFS